MLFCDCYFPIQKLTKGKLVETSVEVQQEHKSYLNIDKQHKRVNSSNMIFKKTCGQIVTFV